MRLFSKCSILLIRKRLFISSQWQRCMRIKNRIDKWNHHMHKIGWMTSKSNSNDEATCKIACCLLYFCDIFSTQTEDERLLTMCQYGRYGEFMWETTDSHPPPHYCHRLDMYCMRIKWRMPTMCHKHTEENKNWMFWMIHNSTQSLW